MASETHTTEIQRNPTAGIGAGIALEEERRKDSELLKIEILIKKLKYSLSG